VPRPRHHLVPQTYLRRFADNKSRVVLVDRDDLAHTVRTGTKNACAEVGFYDWTPDLDPASPPLEPGADDAEFIEKAFSVFESRASGPISRLLASGAPPSDEDRYDLANILALQITRTNRFREDLTAMGTWAARRHWMESLDDEKVAALLREQGRPDSPADVRAFIEEVTGPGGPRLVPDKAFTIQQSIGTALGTFVRALWQRQWVVVRFEQPSILTSDEPVVAWHPEDEPVTAVNAPIVWVPMGRQHVLQLMPSSHHDTSRVGTQREADHINSLVATQADRWIVHHPDDTALVARLDLGPRTAWGEEVLERVVETDGIRETGRYRRLPVPPAPETDWSVG